MDNPKVIAYLKPVCGLERGGRAGRAGKIRPRL